MLLDSFKLKGDEFESSIFQHEIYSNIAVKCVATVGNKNKLAY